MSQKEGICGDAEANIIELNKTYELTKQSLEQLKENQETLKDEIINKLKDCIEKVENCFLAISELKDESATGNHNTTKNQQQQQPNNDSQVSNGDNISNDSIFPPPITGIWIKNYEYRWILLSKDAANRVVSFVNKTDQERFRSAIKYVKTYRLCEYCLVFYVCFTTVQIKDEYLKCIEMLKGEMALRFLTFLDETLHHTVLIEECNNCDATKADGITNVIKIAKEMGLSLTPENIRDIDVFYDAKKNSATYLVEFCDKQTKNTFLTRSYILKKFPNENRSVIIS